MFSDIDDIKIFEQLSKTKLDNKIILEDFKLMNANDIIKSILDIIKMEKEDNNVKRL